MTDMANRYAAHRYYRPKASEVARLVRMAARKGLKLSKLPNASTKNFEFGGLAIYGPEEVPGYGGTAPLLVTGLEVPEAEAWLEAYRPPEFPPSTKTLEEWEASRRDG